MRALYCLKNFTNLQQLMSETSEGRHQRDERISPAAILLVNRIAGIRKLLNDIGVPEPWATGWKPTDADMETLWSTKLKSQLADLQSTYSPRATKQGKQPEAKQAKTLLNCIFNGQLGMSLKVTATTRPIVDGVRKRIRQYTLVPDEVGNGTILDIFDRYQIHNINLTPDNEWLDAKHTTDDTQTTEQQRAEAHQQAKLASLAKAAKDIEQEKEIERVKQAVERNKQKRRTEAYQQILFDFCKTYQREGEGR